MAENVFRDSWDVEQEQPGFTWKRARLGRRLGAQQIGASVYRLPAGERTFPYHFHHANEELAIVLEGAIYVRQPDGEKLLEVGDVVFFSRGEAGAHQIVNRSGADAVILLVSAMVAPEITEFPDTGKVGIFAGHAPGATANGDLKRFLDGRATVDYFADEPL